MGLAKCMLVGLDQGWCWWCKWSCDWTTTSSLVLLRLHLLEMTGCNASLIGISNIRI